MNPRTSYIVALLTVLTIVAIREAMPIGENSMTNSVIFSIVSLAWSMSETSSSTRFPRQSSATPRKSENTII